MDFIETLRNGALWTATAAEGKTPAQQAASGNEEDWLMSDASDDELARINEIKRTEMTEARKEEAAADKGTDEMFDDGEDEVKSPPSQSRSEVVRLDVGGTAIKTTLKTLTAPHEPHSFFRGMFSGKFRERADDKEYFIDRDSRHFHHVLNWLRSPLTFTLPNDQQVITLVVNCLYKLMIVFWV